MCAGSARERKQRSRPPMDHPWDSAGVETTARSWSWRACAVAALWCGLYVVVLLPLLVVYTVVCTFLDAVAAIVSTTPEPASLRRDARPELVFPGTCTWVFWQLGMVQYLVERYDLKDVRVVGTSMEINQCVGCFSAMAWPRWLRRAVGTDTPRYRAGVDGVEVDAAIQDERAVKF